MHVGPMLHSRRMCSIVCIRLPHGHLLDVASPQRCRFLLVLPTLALALFSVTQSFLGRLVPLGRFSSGSWTASFPGLLSDSFQVLSLWFSASSGFRLWLVMKLLRDLSLLSWGDVSMKGVSYVSFLFEFLYFCLGRATNVWRGNPCQSVHCWEGCGSEGSCN